MAITKLFISHSSKTEPARHLRDEVARALDQEADIEVLWDEDIRPGERWRADLDEWLAECDGGVILFSKDAIESAWVLKEAQILTWRRALRGDSFILVPVLLDPVSSKETRMDDWTPVQIREIQFHEGGDPETLSAQGRRDLAAEIVDKVRDQLGRLPEGAIEDPVLYWIERLADDLSNAGKQRLDRAAGEVGLRPQELPVAADDLRRATILTHRLMHFGAEPAVGGVPRESFETAAQVLQKLIWTFDRDAKERVAEQFFPVWVSPDAARDILPLSRAASGKKVLCINGTEARTGQNYADRATCGTASGRETVVWVDDVHAGDRSAITAKYDKKLKDRFHLNAVDKEPRTGWLEELEAVMDEYRRVYVVLHGHACHPDVLESLLRDYPPFTFILMVGDREEDRQAKGFADYPLLRPELPLRRDREVARRYEEIAGSSRRRR